MSEIQVPAAFSAGPLAVAALRRSGCDATLVRLAPGPFGPAATGLCALEALALAVEQGLAAAECLRGLVLADLAPSQASFALAALGPEHRRLVSAFQLVVTADTALARLSALAPLPRVEGALKLDGLPELLETAQGDALALRAMGLVRGYLELHPPVQAPPNPPLALQAVAAISAFWALLRQALLELGRSGVLGTLAEVLARRPLRVAGRTYRGLLVEQPREEPSGLLPVRIEQIVGNDAYLEAGKRLARDVAGYDFERGRNPKRFNPVLFGLGKPGCGKTVTAHAIGHYFLEHCRAREVPARFLIVRRSDWASSYQNASAANLIRIFQEEVHGFAGVCGVYWPDIDTALASRDSSDLRMEEKQNLGAVFGVFDGTLLPKDGKWFLICDANTLHMDEAAVSRIAQNPFTVEGPSEPAHHERLLRLMLGDLAAFLPAEAEAWTRLAHQAWSLGLSGRALDSICGNVRARIQDFDYPDEYFRLQGPEREALLVRLSRSLGEDEVLAEMRSWHEFQQKSGARAEQERFETEVRSMVRQLNASRAAAEQAVGLGLGELA
jgi:hypothetical protein